MRQTFLIPSAMDDSPSKWASMKRWVSSGVRGLRSAAETHRAHHFLTCSRFVGSLACFGIQRFGSAVIWFPTSMAEAIRASNQSREMLVPRSYPTLASSGGNEVCTRSVWGAQVGERSESGIGSRTPDGVFHWRLSRALGSLFLEASRTKR